MSPGSLLRRFALLSVVSVVVILLAVGFGVHRIFRDHLIEGAKSESVVTATAIVLQERATLLDQIPDGTSRIQIDSTEFAGFDKRMRNFLSAVGMIKIKVYDNEKLIVYSTDKAIIGLVDDENTVLDRVLQSGETDSQLVLKDRVSDLHGRERFRVDLVESYVTPTWPAPSPPPSICAWRSPQAR